MKKNISINISGIIFHIEEDGYEQLKNYLDSISSYFSSYEDSKEIIEDIESRIAEIFLMKLNDNKQIINGEDVSSLINTMGTTEDFQASIEIEEDLTNQENEIPIEESEEPKSFSSSGSSSSSSESKRRLFRNKSKKLIGGVASGIANYFSMDPIWVRILLLSLLIFPTFSWPLGSLSFLTFLTYIVLWIALPGIEYEETQKVKKLYRDPDKKVLGGVSSGLANYFGIDKVAVRILFVIGILLGFTGLLLYIILWIITPEASSITEKIEMQGEPVTLSSIESSIKKELNEEQEEGKESFLVKVLLFPFRLIAIVIKGLSQLFTPFLKFIIEAVRVVFGVFVFGLGFFFILGIVVFVISYFGGVASSPLIELDQFHGSGEYLRGIVNSSTLIFGAIAGIIPALFMAILGISIITKKWSVKSYIGWPLLGVWLVGIIGFLVTLPQNINQFDKTDGFKDTKIYSLQDKIPVLKLNELYDDFSAVELRLRGHDSEDFKLLVNYESKGSTRREAAKNAQMITYSIEQQDSVFLFDSNVKKVKPGYEFKFQEASVIFYIPYNRPFMMTRDLSDILRNTLYLSGYNSYQMEGNSWVFNNEGQIACLTCEEEPDNATKPDYGTSSYRKSRSSSNSFSISNYRGTLQTIDVKDFNSISADGLFEIEVQKGDEYSVQIRGSKRSVEKTEIFTRGRTLNLHFNKKGNWFFNSSDSDKIGVLITMPEIEEIDLSGASKIYMQPFNMEKLSIDMSGASFMEAEIQSGDVIVDLSGASSLILTGNTATLNLEISGASKANAEDLIAERVKVDAGGASKAEVYASEELDLEAGGASKITYSGQGKVNKKRSGGARIRKD